MIEDSLIWVTICFHFLNRLLIWFDFSEAQLTALNVLSTLTWSLWWLQFSCDTWLDWMLLMSLVGFISFIYPPILSDFSFPFFCLWSANPYLDPLSYQSSYPPFWSFSFPFFHVYGFNIHASCWYLLAHIIPICLYKVRLICFGVYVIPFNDLVMTWTNNVILFLFFLQWIFPLLVSCSGSSVLNSNYSYIECLSGREANRTEMEYLSWYWIFA